MKFSSESEKHYFEILTWIVKKKSCYIKEFHLFMFT
jgi:hypothetical protein